MGKMILRILRIQPWLGPTKSKLHCFGVSISFNLIYIGPNIILHAVNPFVENFCQN